MHSAPRSTVRTRAGSTDLDRPPRGDRSISGTPDPRWDGDDLDQLRRVPGSAFEVVRADGQRRG